jgi:phosphate transport system permease protein
MAVHPARDVPLGTKPTISRKRRVIDRLWWAGCGVGMLFVVIPVLWVLIGIAQRAIPTWQWDIFTKVSVGANGGLLNAIVGTIMITGGTGILAGLLGVGSGIYLAEFAPKSWTSTVLRGATEMLSGVPSIVFGFCGYIALVLGLHWGYSWLAALIVMSLLVVPYIAKSTEIAMNQVPLAYREGAEALGLTMPYTLRKVVIRPALPGILTGMILALAISVGETAPLLYTASFSNSVPSGALIHAPVAFLTYAVYSFYDSPTPATQHLASDAALMLAVIVLGLIMLSRLLVHLTQKYSPDRKIRPSRQQRREAKAVAAGARSSS